MPKIANPVDHFATRFEVRGMDECWPWTAGDTGRGYGVFRSWMFPDELASHRIMWIIENGSIPEGAWVLHKCDNRRCVNPSHLFLGTVQDNNEDREQKGRGIYASGFAHPRSRITPEQVVRIQELRSHGLRFKDIAKEIGCGYGTIARHCNKQTKHYTPNGY